MTPDCELMEPVPELFNIDSEPRDYCDWDLSNIDLSELNTDVNNPIDLYLECHDDELYSVPQSQHQTFTPSLIGQNVHLQISFPTDSNKNITETLLQCQICEKQFTRDKKLKDHLKDFHQINKPYCCMCCPYTSTCVKLLNRHIKRCSATTARRTNNLESGDNPIMKEAGEIASSRTGYDNTNGNCESMVLGPISGCVTTFVQKPFHCDLCPFKTNSKSLLSCHVGTKHNLKRHLFTCSTCDFECRQKRTLLIHTKSHEEHVEIEVCDVCNKTFVSHEKLKRHKLIHSEQRLYKCNLCPSSFKIQGILTDHIKSVHLKTTIKSNIKSIACTWPGCKKLFRDKHNLNVHYKTHSCEDMFKCDLCQYRSIYKKSFKSHKEKIHQLFSCEIVK